MCLSCCLSEQSKRHLDTILWRFKTLVKRDKKTLFFALCYPIMFLGMGIGLGSINPSTDENYEALINDNFIVTGDYSDAGVNDFIYPGSDFQSNQKLQACRKNFASSIGIVKDGNDESIAVLESIFKSISDNYALEDPSGEALVMQNFTNYDSLNDHVQSSDYQTDQLCFSLGWSTYDVDNSDFALMISTQYEFLNMTDANDPQDRYYNNKYSQSALKSYGNTDYLQVMALATQEVLKKTQTKLGSDTLDTFSLMYTPMTTGTFSYQEKDGKSITYVLVYETIALVLAMLVSELREQHEETIELIMKRLGVQKSVIVIRDMMTMLIYGALWIPIAALSEWGTGFSDGIGIGVWLMFTYLYYLQVVGRTIVLQHLLPPGFGTGFTGMFFVVQIALSFTFVAEVPQLSMVVLGCLISPLIQLFVVLHMAQTTGRFDFKLGFSQLSYEVYPSISLQLVLIIGICMMIFYYLVLAYMWPLYIETDPERPLRWYYPFTPSYWKGGNSEHDDDKSHVFDSAKYDEENNMLEPLISDEDKVDTSQLNLQETEKLLINKGILQVPSLHLKEDIGKLVMTGLSKKYGKNLVVDDLSMTFYQNEILVLLGHNGAGKTTTLNMLTGLTKPTSGTAVAHFPDSLPVDLFTDYQNIADFIGLCPQVDVLFTKMTVRENLIFYCKLKKIEDMDRVIDDTLEKFNLTSKQTAFASNISGGQKRKLQLAIALLGNSKIVLLDEPTSGMDPTARRETWEIIKEAKQDKIIILTTHYMDEAEFLADRVAVISRGSLKVCGDTSFLKTKFGHYFYLEVDPINPDKPEPTPALLELLQSHNQRFMDNRASQGSSSGIIEEENGRSDTIVSVQAKFDPVTVRVDEAGKIVYKLANYMSQQFREIFEAIDAAPQNFGIDKYRIKNMTLEQVFIAIGDQEIKEDQEKEESSAGKVEQEMIDDLPLLQKPGFCGLFKATGISTMQSYHAFGVTSLVIIMLIVAVFFFLLVYLPFIVRSEDTLNFNDLSGIFGSDSMELKYNENYDDGSQNSIAKRIATKNTNLEGQPQANWYMKDDEDYSTFLGYLATNLTETESNKQKSAYWVDASKSDNNAWNISAVIYANISSPVTAPVFGNLLLQSIAQEVSGNDDFKLNFEYQAFKQNVATSITADVNVGVNIVNVGGYFAFFAEILMTVHSFKSKTSYTTYMMRGGNRQIYMLTKSVIDFFISYFTFQILFIANVIYGVDTTGWQTLGILFAVAQSLWLTIWNIVIFEKPGLLILRFLLFTAQAAMILFFSAFSDKYIDNGDGQSLPNTLCYINGYSPTVQLLYGMFFTQYRYAVYVLQQPDSVAETSVDQVTEVGPFSEYGAQTPFTILLIQLGAYSVMSMLFLMICKNSQFAEPSDIEPEKDDYDQPSTVQEEADRIKDIINGGENGRDVDGKTIIDSDEVLIVNNLVKRYYTAPPVSDDNNIGGDRPSQVDTRDNADGEPDNQPDAAVVPGFNAVKGTSFGVKKGEVFSLLGVNGAGKSSTFGCMVGEHRVSGGTVLIDGQNVDNYVSKPYMLHGLIGYCPQTNTFDDVLTVRQTIYFICRLVGVPDNVLEAYVSSSMKRFGVSRFADTQAGSLSGGNKRKLTLAMAMIGRPKIIFIDEASTGVDPGSRRTMWQAIRHEGQDSAVVLTTHAMEEAEAISTKIAIQVQGWFRSFGTLAQVQGEKGGEQSGYFAYLKIDLKSLIINIFSEDQQETIVKDREDVIKQLNDWEEYLRVHRNSDKPLKFADELKPYGLLDKFDSKLKAGQSVNLKNVLRELLMQDTMAAVMNDIQVLGVGSARILNYDGAGVTMEITNCSKTFGQIYAFFEGIKAKHQIKEYSCKMSSLEEVFNGHATESMYMELNKRLDRRRTSITYSSVQE